MVASIYIADEMRKICTGKMTRQSFMSYVTLSLLMQSQEIFWQKPVHLSRESFQKEVLYQILKDFCLELIMAAFMAITVKKAAFS